MNACMRSSLLDFVFKVAFQFQGAAWRSVSRSAPKYRQRLLMELDLIYRFGFQDCFMNVSLLAQERFDDCAAWDTKLGLRCSSGKSIAISSIVSSDHVSGQFISTFGYKQSRV